MSVEAVTELPSDIVAASLAKPRPGGVGERPVTLDGQDLPAEPRQDGGLVSRAGADLQHAVLLLQLQLFGHVSDHKRLADGLPAGDTERAVTVSIGPIGRLDEHFARNLLHGAKHRLIADPAASQGELKHHLFRRFPSSRHVSLASWARISDSGQ